MMDKNQTITPLAIPSRFRMMAEGAIPQEQLINFSFWVAVHITSVGLLFSLLPVVKTSLIELKAPTK